MTDAISSVAFREFISGWRPASVILDDVVAAQRVQEFAATLDLDEQFVNGGSLPPLWQWAFFRDWPRTDELGPDGHPRHGHFLPPIPNRRRMFAGGRVTIEAPLLIGRHASRQSEIVGVTVKHGRTGELLFVTVRHSYFQDGSLRVVEEQDLVYRSDAGAATPFTRGAKDIAVSAAPWSSSRATSPELLFRFSAVTGNAHRIHYDEPYTTGTEGYPALVVHGPLLAVYMAELVRRKAADRPIRTFSFRLQRPAFVGDPIRVEGTPRGSTIDLAVVSGIPTAHATATAVLA